MTRRSRNEARIRRGGFEFDRPDKTGYELDHGYGEHVHVLNDPLLLTLIAYMGHPETGQHNARLAIGEFFKHAIHYAAIQEKFPLADAEIPTRMQQHVGSAGVYCGPIIDPDQKLVVVSIERGGGKPTHDLVDYLSLATGCQVRLDSVTAERTTDKDHVVTGCRISGAKIGGSVDDAILIIPDPMGATGGTVLAVRDLYEGKLGLANSQFPLPDRLGKYKKMITLHAIVATEYVQRMRSEFPELRIYAGRVDRGLSDDEILGSRLGMYPSQERGLTDTQYIVPGAGDVGALLSGELKQPHFSDR